MEIVWYGHSFFEIQTRELRIILDPFSEKIGLVPPKKLKGDVLLISHSHPGHSNKALIGGNYVLIEEPGEYEIRNVFIDAIESFHDAKEGKERGRNLIFSLEIEGWKVCHFGDFGQKELSDEQKRRIGNLDILFLPVGGVSTISPKEAVKIIKELEPKIVIPMHYFLPNLKFKLEKIEEFLKLMGVKKASVFEKFKIKKGEILPEETNIVLLKYEPKN